MKVEQIAVGELYANAFIVYQEESNKAFVVDPGADFEKIKERLKARGIGEVTHILLTHGHFDHIGAAAALKQETGAKICIHERDLPMLKSGRHNLAVFSGFSIPECEADIILKGGETIAAADMDVAVLHTPGHSGGSVCYLCGDALFAGDTLFYMSVGRTDFPGSDSAEYRHTLDTVLRGIRRDYDVYTGHGIRTTLYAEFKSNPFLNGTI
ncbi:MAG: MBL fold metallo-hydrolase [Eubacteriales bacterium]|nr:MBL fold metallo-hydrolase [Eubacteriales bacterium]